MAAKSATVTVGGYDYCFADANLDKYSCKICTKVSRNPHQTGCCGQVFCESCLNTWFTKHRKESCPHCRAEVWRFQHFLDRRIKREIDSLRIHCTNKEEGCQWIGELGSLKDHLESATGCDYGEVECPLCSPMYNVMSWHYWDLIKSQDEVVKIKRKYLENHLKNECPNRPYQCEHCGHKDTYEKITGGSFYALGEGYEKITGGSFYALGESLCFYFHYGKCPEFPLECPNKCGVKDIKRKDMEDHHSQCPEEIVECTNKCQQTQKQNVPNKFTILKRKDLARHLADVCELRLYQCKHCGKKDTYKAITTEHYKDCPDFPLKCPNKCDSRKQIKRKDIKHHRTQCPEEVVECPNKCEPIESSKCKLATRMKRKDLDRHLTKECSLRPYQCEHCALKDTYKTITTEHYNKCSNFPVVCPNLCGRNDIKRKDIKDHRSQCPEEPVQCPFEEVGCKESLVRCELEQHLGNQQQHLLLVMGAYKEMKKENEEMKKELKEANEEMKKDYKGMEKVQLDLIIAHKETQHKLSEIKRELSETEAKLKQTKDEILQLKPKRFPW